MVLCSMSGSNDCIFCCFGWIYGNIFIECIVKKECILKDEWNEIY